MSYRDRQRPQPPPQLFFYKKKKHEIVNTKYEKYNGKRNSPAVAAALARPKRSNSNKQIDVKQKIGVPVPPRRDTAPRRTKQIYRITYDLCFKK